MNKLSERFNTFDSGLIIDLMTGKSFSANPTGLMIFRGLIEGKDRQQLISSLTKEFDVDDHTALRDYEEFIVELKSFNLHER
ncbi:MAG: PqqD family protein [Candidatus Riflebacteria bacterium]|nr:PqqD family protein [Candidatus Riflebacteria bacterium]